MKKIVKLLSLLAFAAAMQVNHAFAQTPAATDQHLKKDGTVDKRYKATKTAASANAPASAAPAAQTTTPATTGQRLKKDGTADKRYKPTSAAATITAPSSTGSGNMSNDMQMNTPAT